MRILYLPIFDPSHHAVALANKRGLHDALVRSGHEVKEWDYCALPDERMFAANLMIYYREFQPDILLTQFQGVNYMDAELAANMRAHTHIRNPIWFNINQDYWPEHLTAPDMLAMLKHVDCQLVANASVLPDYETSGVNAAYWAAAYEPPVHALPDVPAHDIVFLGNAYSDLRRELGQRLKALPYNVGLYGTGWENADGDCNYDFAYGEALYKKAKIAVSDNQFPEAVASLSTRPFQILGAGSALLLQQRVKQLFDYTGLIGGQHFAEWRTFDSLVSGIEFYMKVIDNPSTKRIVREGQRFIAQQHSYDARVSQLMALVEGLRV